MKKTREQFIGKMDSKIMQELNIKGSGKVFLRSDFMDHIEIRGHMDDFKKHGKHLKSIVESPMWYRRTTGRKKKYLFVQQIKGDYVCVAVHQISGRLSVRTFYIKDNPNTVKGWIASRTLLPLDRRGRTG